jgi:hypothetical protein
MLTPDMANELQERQKENMLAASKPMPNTTSGGTFTPVAPGPFADLTRAEARKDLYKKTEAENPILATVDEAILLLDNDIATFEARLSDLKVTRFQTNESRAMYESAQDHLIAALQAKLHLLQAKVAQLR